MATAANNTGESWTDLHDGVKRQFCLLSIDIVGHSGLYERHDENRVDTVLLKFRQMAAEICERQRGKECSWGSDGGVFLFFENHLCDDAVIAGMKLVEQMPVFNRSTTRTHLAEDIEVRVVAHIDLAIYHTDPGNIRCAGINDLKHNERALGVPGRLAVTQPVYARLAPPLKNAFVLAPRSPLRLERGDGHDLQIAFWWQREGVRAAEPPFRRPRLPHQMSTPERIMELDPVISSLLGVSEPHLAPALWYGLRHGEDVHRLFDDVLTVLEQAILDGEDVAPAFQAMLPFSLQSVRILRERSTLSSLIGIRSLRCALMDLMANPLSSVLGHQCRVRIWVLPSGSDKYSGVLSLRMGESFRIKFEAGGPLYTDLAPYEPLAGSNCLILRSETTVRILGQLSDDRAKRALHWYKTELFESAEESYTWHFPQVFPQPVDGVVYIGEAPANTDVWAVSFDLGTRDAVCDRPRLRMVDRLICAVGEHLPAHPITVLQERGIGEESHGVCVGAVDTHEPERNPVAPAEQTRTSNPLLGLDAAQALFLAPFDCVPCSCFFSDRRRPPHPLVWVFSRDDPAVTDVLKWVTTLRSRNGVGSACIVGPSGTGKGMLAKALLGGLGGRSGTLEPWRVGTDLEAARAAFLGTEKGAFTGAEVKPSVCELCAGGVVYADEFISRLATDSEFDQLKGTVEDAIRGYPLRRLQNGREWESKALIVFSSTPEFYKIVKERHQEWVRRFGRKVTVPGWLDLSPKSRAVILRWFMLEQMDRCGFDRASIHLSAFHWLVVAPDPEECFRCTNMDGVAKIVEYAADLSALDSSSLTLRPEAVSDTTRELGYGAPRLTSGDGWLTIGRESPWESGLDKFEELIVELAKRTESSVPSQQVVDRDPLRDALGRIETPEQVLSAAYLLYAAVRRAPASPEDDPWRTACNRYQDHFANKGPWQALLKEKLGATPADLKIRGPSKGRIGSRFENHVQVNTRTLQAEVERIACAYPPFFHVVPYWCWPDLFGGIATSCCREDQGLAECCREDHDRAKANSAGRQLGEDHDESH